MTPEEFQELVSDNAKWILENYKSPKMDFSPDREGIEEGTEFDYYWHILEWLKDKQDENPELAVWLFNHAGEDLEHDKKFPLKLCVLEMFGSKFLFKKKLIEEFLKGLSKEELAIIEGMDNFPYEIKSVLSEVFYEHKLGTATLFKFILFSGLKVKRLESKVFVGHSLEVVIQLFADYIRVEYCNGIERQFDIHTNGDMKSLFVTNNLYEGSDRRSQGFEVNFSKANELDYRTYSSLLTKWCREIQGVEAVVELVAVEK